MTGFGTRRSKLSMVSRHARPALTAIPVALLVSMLAVAGAGTASQAQDAAGFYKGKTFKFVVGFGTGGGFDAYARLGADMLKKHLPGIATIIVENKPGGGGLIASAHFYAQGARDGTMMAVFPEQLANNQMLQPKLAQWKTEEMRYVGSFAPVNSGLLLRKGAAARSTADMKTVESAVGCDGVASQGYQYPAMLKNLGGFKFKMVCGYRGSPAYLLALERGEIDIASNAWNALRITHPQKIASGEVVLFAQGGLRRDPEIKDAPLLQELVEKRGRFGRKNGKGFYDYPQSGPKRLWPGLAELQKKKLDPDRIDIQELKYRLLFVQSLEAARCVEEGVITDVREADVGSILGFGFAPFSGGTLSYIDMMGTKRFVDLCKKLEKKYGERFKPPKLLLDMAQKGDTFYGRFAPGAAQAA